MRARLKIALLLLGAAVLVAGCASTTLQSVWKDPSYTGGAFRKIFVIGLSDKSVTARRVYEDIMVGKLQAAGVQAVPAWQFVSSEAPVGEAALQAAVAQSGADAVLMSRLIDMQTQTQVSTAMVPGPGFGWYGFYSGWYAVPQVTQYQIATVETTLFDEKSRKLVWTATSQTLNPTTVQQEAPGLADTLIGSMRAGGFLPPAK